MMRKGQIVLTDILTAFAVFILIADASIFLWEYEIARAGNVQSSNLMEDAARAASNQLLTAGEPSDWQVMDLNQSTLHSFGLTSSGNVLAWDKVERIGKLRGDSKSYGKVKGALGLDCCEAWIGVLYENGTGIESFGNAPPNGIAAVSIDRKALLNSSPVTVRITVWQ